MEELNLIPIYRQGINELSDGIDIHVTDYCKKNCNFNAKCIEHYRLMFLNKEGIYICPYGFNTAVFRKNNEVIIFSSLRIKEKYIAKKADPKIQRCDNNNIIGYNTYKQYIEAYLDFWNTKSEYKEYKEFIENIFHDFRKFNRTLKEKSSKLVSKSENLKKGGDFKELARGIQATSSYFTIGLNCYDFAYNEQMIEASGKSYNNFYKMFDKVRKYLRDKADQKNLKIILNSNGECPDCKVSDGMEIVPSIIIDNAIKYSYPNKDIIINIIDNINKINITVESESVLVINSELECIFNRGYRGKYAETIADGRGIGLYLAKRMCDFCGIKICAKSSNEILHTKKDIPYSKFTIVMEMEK